MRRELRKVQTAAAKRAEAVYAFEAAIIEAREAGLTLREIASVAGITNPAVLFIERRARRRLVDLASAPRLTASELTAELDARYLREPAESCCNRSGH